MLYPSELQALMMNSGASLADIPVYCDYYAVAISRMVSSCGRDLCIIHSRPGRQLRHEQGASKWVDNLDSQFTLHSPFNTRTHLKGKPSPMRALP